MKCSSTLKEPSLVLVHLGIIIKTTKPFIEISIKLHHNHTSKWYYCMSWSELTRDGKPYIIKFVNLSITHPRPILLNEWINGTIKCENYVLFCFVDQYIGNGLYCQANTKKWAVVCLSTSLAQSTVGLNSTILPVTAYASKQLPIKKRFRPSTHHLKAQYPGLHAAPFTPRDMERSWEQQNCSIYPMTVEFWCSGKNNNNKKTKTKD